MPCPPLSATMAYRPSISETRIGQTHHLSSIETTLKRSAHASSPRKPTGAAFVADPAKDS